MGVCTWSRCSDTRLLAAEEIHAAAAAALKALPAGRSTLFFSESDESSGAAGSDTGMQLHSTGMQQLHQELCMQAELCSTHPY